MTESRDGATLPLSDLRFLVTRRQTLALMGTSAAALTILSPATARDDQGGHAVVAFEAADGSALHGSDGRAFMVSNLPG